MAGSIDPVPLRAGHLLAQQVEDGGRYGLSGWSVHEGDTTHVGDMSTGITARGRRYVTGRLHDSVPIEAPTAQACLRKLAKIYAQQGVAG